MKTKPNEVNENETGSAADEMEFESIILPPGVAQAMDAVLDYLWAAEKEDFDAKSKQERAGHIFRALIRLRTWSRFPEAKVRGSTQGKA